MLQDVPYFRAKIKYVPEPENQQDDPEAEALRRAVFSQFVDYVEVSQKLTAEILPGIEAIASPGRLADIITSNLELKTDEKQQILEAVDVAKRLEMVSEFLREKMKFSRSNRRSLRRSKTASTKIRENII